MCMSNRRDIINNNNNNNKTPVLLAASMSVKPLTAEGGGSRNNDAHASVTAGTRNSLTHSFGVDSSLTPECVRRMTSPRRREDSSIKDQNVTDRGEKKKPGAPGKKRREMSRCGR